MQLYTSWASVLDNEGAENLFLNFSEIKTYRNNSKEIIDLVKDGRDVEVDDSNKYQYVYEM
jgi:hypothetical protein